MLDGRKIELPKRRLRANYHPASGVNYSHVGQLFQNVFLDTGSMTALLRELVDPGLQVEVLKHAIELPSQDDAKILKVHNEPGIVREVLLLCQNQPWMYARSFIPSDLVRAYGNHFTGLGARPLGELLFANPQVVRSEFSVAMLKPGHREYHKATDCLAEKPRQLWSRRSTFCLPNGKLVLTEVFLPAMMAGLLC